MTIITIDMSLGSTGPNSSEAIRHTKAVAVSGLASASAPFCDRVRNRHGRHIAGMNGHLPRLGESKIRIAPIHAPRRRSGLPLPGITDRDDFAVCRRRPCLARPWTGATRCDNLLRLANDPRGLIVAVDPDRVSELAPACQACQDLSLRPTASSWPRPSVLVNRHLARSAAGHLMMSQLRL